MKIKIIGLCIALAACSLAARAQETATAQSQTEQPVALAQKSVALDRLGREALAASLLTSALQGTPEA
ncbi:MAG: hypothetical protein ICV68_14175, partial [Pyrinomonadaceae bacterium]|nr:hypothetical protein [Pyrinomonadaceae bacterium]